MHKVAVILLVLANIFVVIFSAPAEPTNVKNCFKHACPEKTAQCDRHTVVAKDKKNLNNTVNCLDIKGKILQTFEDSEPNPFSPGTYYEGYAYSGVFEFNLHGENGSKKPSETDTDVSNKLKSNKP